MIVCRTIEIQTAAGWKGRKKSSCRLLWNSSLAPSRKQRSSRSPLRLKASNDIAAHRPDATRLLMELRDRRPENFKRLERSEAIERNNLLLTIANSLTP